MWLQRHVQAAHEHTERMLNCIATTSTCQLSTTCTTQVLAPAQPAPTCLAQRQPIRRRRLDLAQQRVHRLAVADAQLKRAVASTIAARCAAAVAPLHLGALVHHQVHDGAPAVR